jgi:hypothetical protein
MKFNVGIAKKGYCFVELPDMTYDEYMDGDGVHEKVMKAIEDKYGSRLILGYCPTDENSLA